MDVCPPYMDISESPRYVVLLLSSCVVFAGRPLSMTCAEVAVGFERGGWRTFKEKESNKQCGGGEGNSSLTEKDRVHPATSLPQ